MNRLKQFLSERQSTLTAGLSALLIIVLAFLFFNYFSTLNKQTVTKETVATQDATQSGLLTPATHSGILDELSIGKQKQATSSASNTQPSKEVVKQPSAPTQNQSYTVVHGDTLSTIASRYYGDPSKYTLISSLKENNITNPNLIHGGNVFIIPAATTASNPSSPLAVLPRSGIGSTELSTQITHTYTVHTGDTLWAIAQQYLGSGFAWETIRSANADRIGFLPNQTGNQALIIPGQVLTIPSQ